MSSLISPAPAEDQVLPFPVSVPGGKSLWLLRSASLEPCTAFSRLIGGCLHVGVGDETGSRVTFSPMAWSLAFLPVLSQSQQ